MGAPVGKVWDGGVHLVDRAEFLAYAEATDDPNPAYRGPDGVAPPMFHVRPINTLLYTMARDPELELDYLRLVHGEHAMAFHRPLRHGDRLAVRSELKSLEDKPSGRVATFALFGDVDGQRVFDGSTTFFIRREGGGGGAKKPSAPAEDPGPATFEVDQPVAADQAARYAEASGDRNPIHLDPEVALEAGLPGPILHGLCTMAFAQRDLIRIACDGDPERLAELAVRWVKPVLLGETLRLSAWDLDRSSASGLRDLGGGRWAFVIRNAKGELVVGNGRAAVRG